MNKPAAKIPRRKISGVLLLDKPAGITSNTALQKVKRLFRAEKAGHTGTLDPFATGLLPLCLGEATKFSQYLLDADKVYEAVVKLGVRTSTGDPEGEVLETRPANATEADVQRVLPRFLGEILQTPPMHSALKHAGRPLYSYARQGIEIARPPRQVRVDEIELIALNGDELTIRVHCGKGLYVRTLAEDIGEALGCGAHLSALDRLEVGALHLADAFSLEELEAMSETERDECLSPSDLLVEGYRRLDVDAESAWQISHGQAVWHPGLQVGEMLRGYAPDGRFLGMLEVDQEGKAAPRRLVVY